jgi:hypothetical protein
MLSEPTLAIEGESGRMRHAAIVVIGAVLVLASCAPTVTTVRTVSQAEYQERSWVGHTAEDVAVAWGENAGKEPDGTGGRVLIYRRAATSYVSSAGASSANPRPEDASGKNDQATVAQGGTADEILAKFWIDSNDKVYRYWFANEVYKKGLDAPSAKPVDTYGKKAR